MALPQRLSSPTDEPTTAAPPIPLSPITGATAPWSERHEGFDAGGEVGRMHAELAARLAGPVHLADSPGERLIRRLSVAGGYAALAAGYGVAAMLLLR